MSYEGERASGAQAGRKLADPVFCRAKPAIWPNTVYCLVHEPDKCKNVRYFNEVPYCTHPKREAIIARTKASKDDLSGHSH